VHTMWKGFISFGLVNIPVNMYAATEEKRLRFRYLHRKCQTPIQTVRKCPKCEQEIAWNEVVRGYEYQDGHYVLMEKDELDELLPDSKKAIEILDFVKLDEIDPIYFNKTYYLGAQEKSNKAYVLLRDALKTTGKIAIARVILRSKQTLAVVRVYQNCLVMETIFYPDEVRSIAQIPDLPEAPQLTEREETMAVQLIEQLTTTFQPENYQDTYREMLEERIQKKIHHEQVVEAPESKPEKVVDLMEALQASLNKVKEDKLKEKTS